MRPREVSRRKLAMCEAGEISSTCSIKPGRLRYNKANNEKEFNPLWEGFEAMTPRVLNFSIKCNEDFY